MTCFTCLSYQIGSEHFERFSKLEVTLQSYCLTLPRCLLLHKGSKWRPLPWLAELHQWRHLKSFLVYKDRPIWRKSSVSRREYRSQNRVSSLNSALLFILKAFYLSDDGRRWHSSHQRKVSRSSFLANTMLPLCSSDITISKSATKDGTLQKELSGMLVFGQLDENGLLVAWSTTVWHDGDYVVDRKSR